MWLQGNRDFLLRGSVIAIIKQAWNAECVWGKKKTKIKLTRKSIIKSKRGGREEKEREGGRERSKGRKKKGWWERGRKEGRK